MRADCGCFGGYLAHGCGGAVFGVPGQGEDRAHDGETFLRGTQVTDGEGRVEFETIYPGWYPGRTVHIHFRAYTEEGSLVGLALREPGSISGSKTGSPELEG